MACLRLLADLGGASVSFDGVFANAVSTAKLSEILFFRRLKNDAFFCTTCGVSLVAGTAGAGGTYPSKVVDEAFEIDEFDVSSLCACEMEVLVLSIVLLLLEIGGSWYAGVLGRGVAGLEEPKTRLKKPVLLFEDSMEG